MLINTNLSEQQFITRLNNLCVPHRPFDIGYRYSDVFVVRRNGKKFRIGRHSASLGKGNGYLSEFIFGRYVVEYNGKVTICYRFGRPIFYLIPFIIITAVAAPVFVYLLWDMIFNGYYQWGGLTVTALLTFVGLFCVLFRSQKNKQIVEKHLIEICFSE